MKILIHGTIGGHRDILTQASFPEDIKAVVSRDLRAFSNTEQTIGSKCYSVGFAPDGSIFSVYIIVRDVNRASATGFVAFEIFVPNSVYFKGHELVEMLDEISQAFENSFVHHGNLDMVPDTWPELIVFIEKYQHRSHALPEADRVRYFHGEGKPAYVYYQDSEALAKWFEDPYRVEFRDRSRIFLVDEKYFGRGVNPLNSLGHDREANLTDKVSPEVPKYEFFNAGYDNILVEVVPIGSGRPLQNGDKIKGSRELTISFSKPYFFCAGPFSGTVDELLQMGILKLNASTFGIEVSIGCANIKPLERELRYKLIMYERPGDAGLDLIFRSTTDGTNKRAENGRVTFFGKEWGDTWRPELVGDTRNSHRLTDNRSICPEQIKEILQFEVVEQQKVRIEVSKVDRTLSSEITIAVDGKGARTLKGQDYYEEFLFENKEIDRSWYGRVTATGYEAYKFKFTPRNETKKVCAMTKSKDIEGGGSDSALLLRPLKGRKGLTILLVLLVLAVVGGVCVNKDLRTSKQFRKRLKEIEDYFLGAKLNEATIERYYLEADSLKNELSWLSNLFYSSDSDEGDEEGLDSSYPMQILRDIRQGNVVDLQGVLFQRSTELAQLDSAVKGMQASGTLMMSIGDAMRQKYAADNEVIDLNEVAKWINEQVLIESKKGSQSTKSHFSKEETENSQNGNPAESNNDKNMDKKPIESPRGKDEHKEIPKGDKRPNSEIPKPQNNGSKRQSGNEVGNGKSKSSKQATEPSNNGSSKQRKVDTESGQNNSGK